MLKMTQAEAILVTKAKAKKEKCWDSAGVISFKAFFQPTTFISVIEINEKS